MKASLDTVARAAGVSPSTVSRALSRPEMVNESTRRRVLNIASELGYRLNAAAQGLATGRTMALALLVPDIANPFFPELVRAAEDRAQEAGYSMLLTDTDEREEREQRLLDQLAGRADGLVVCSPRSSAAGILAIAREVPTVLVNRTVDTIPSVTCVTRTGMARLVDHLQSLGHREVAYLQGPASSWSNKERLRSVRARTRQLGMRLQILGPYTPTLESGRKAAEDLTELGVTAVMAFDDLTAMGVLSRFWDLGIRVPDDISVAGCDDVFCAALCSPPLTTVTSSISLAGTTAVDLLLERLSPSPPSQARHVSLVGDLVVRATTGPARRRRR